jgi:hypothetical protein
MARYASALSHLSNTCSYLNSLQILFTLGIWLLCAQVLAHRSSTSSLQVYIQHWHVVSPAVLHLHFQSHPLILAFRILIPGSAVPTPPFASSVLSPGSILTHMSCPIPSTFLALFDTHVVLHYPLGMGVPIVFHHVVNQPHTSSPHFASFPYGLPDHLFTGSISFTCTSAGS